MYCPDKIPWSSLSRYDVIFSCERDQTVNFEGEESWRRLYASDSEQRKS